MPLSLPDAPPSAMTSSATSSLSSLHNAVLPSASDSHRPTALSMVSSSLAGPLLDLNAPTASSRNSFCDEPHPLDRDSGSSSDASSDDGYVSDPVFANHDNLYLEIVVSDMPPAGLFDYQDRMRVLHNRISRRVITGRGMEEYLYNIARDPSCAEYRSRSLVPCPNESYGPMLPWPNPDDAVEVDRFFAYRRLVLRRRPPAG